jgi:hypothetical protein
MSTTSLLSSVWTSCELPWVHLTRTRRHPTSIAHYVHADRLEHPLFGMRARLRRRCRHRLPAVRCGLTLRPPLPLITAHADQDLVLIMGCGSHTDTVVMRSRRSRTGVDLTCQHKNQTLLVKGPEITTRPVGTRRLAAGGPQ